MEVSDFALHIHCTLFSYHKYSIRQFAMKFLIMAVLITAAAAATANSARCVDISEIYQSPMGPLTDWQTVR